MKTLQDIIAECAATATPPAAPVDNPNQMSGDKSHPFWVMLVNVLRQPPRPKFVCGCETIDQAEAQAKVLQDKADVEAKIDFARRVAEAADRLEQEVDVAVPEEVTKFRYFAITRPEIPATPEEVQEPPAPLVAAGPQRLMPS